MQDSLGSLYCYRQRGEELVLRDNGGMIPFYLGVLHRFSPRQQYEKARWARMSMRALGGGTSLDADGGEEGPVLASWPRMWDGLARRSLSFHSGLHTILDGGPLLLDV